ncbi:hypothetical protein ACQY0O_004160 [Thecaphora frezii]|nr:opsin-1-like protein [Thecaphora frezii]
MNAFYALPSLDEPRVGIPPIPPSLSHPEQTTQAGHAYLWLVFAIMALSSLAFFVASQRAPYRYRLVHTTTFFITAIAALSYFAMATGVGKRLVHSPDTLHPHPREFFYARYIDWFFTTPLLLLDLALLAGLPVAEIIVLLFVDLIMISTGIIAALHPVELGKWGFFAFSTLALVYIVAHLVTSGRRNASLRGPKVARLYNQVSVALVAVWSLYPVAFALGEATHRLSPDQEVLFFAILDVVAKPVWGAWLLVATPEEGKVLVPESWSTPAASPSGGGYGAIASEPRDEDA